MNSTGFKSPWSIVFKYEGADSNRLSISLAVLFSEIPNYGGDTAPSDSPVMAALQYTLYIALAAGYKY